MLYVYPSKLWSGYAVREVGGFLERTVIEEQFARELREER